jgi:cysteine desulfuration protein SufE
MQHNRQTALHNELIDELQALTTVEDKLSWLMERKPLHAPIIAEDRTESSKIPGCLSGLWLKAELSDGYVLFQAFSESDLVHGITSYVCDLYSYRAPKEILTLGASLAQSLKLDGLLSSTRKRALSSTVSFITNSASKYLMLRPAAYSVF